MELGFETDDLAVLRARLAEEGNGGFTPQSMGWGEVIGGHRVIVHRFKCRGLRLDGEREGARPKTTRVGKGKQSFPAVRPQASPARGHAAVPGVDRTLHPLALSPGERYPSYPNATDSSRASQTQAE